MRDDFLLNNVKAVKNAAEEGSLGISTLIDFKNFLPNIVIIFFLSFLILIT